MKKILSLFMAVLLLCCFTVSSSAATYKATWTLTANSGKYTSNDVINVAPGETVKVTLSLSNNYYVGPTTAQLFYTSAMFDGSATATFNKDGKLYATCGAQFCTFVDWNKIAVGNRNQGWPNFSADKLAEFKKTHQFARITMTPNVMLTDKAAKSVNEELLTISFKVKSNVKDGDVGEIVLPIESMRSSAYKTGYFFCAIYTDGDMTKTPIAYSDSQSFDCKKASLKFKVKDDAVSINPEALTVNFKDTAKLEATVNKGKVKTVNWSSSDPSVVSVDKDGNITATGKGTATIKATTTDGRYSGECTVTVKYSFWQIIIIYLLFGFIWYK